MNSLKTTLLSAAFLIGTMAIAQGTTEEEYNYLTKGYAIQVSSGLDMKKGYTLKDLGDWKIQYTGGVQRQTMFKALMRDSSDVPCAILMIYKKSDVDTRFYYCIPTGDADSSLWERTYKQVHDAASAYGSAELDSALIYGLMNLSAQEATK